jgi:hypothetical protein
MPHMQGIDLPSRPSRPVLMVTAEAKKDQIVMAARGVNGYTVKLLRLQR